MGRFAVPILVLVAVASLFAVSLSSQQCPLPPSPFQREANMFFSEQEMDLGDVVAQHLEGDFSVIKDEELNRYLRAIGERLLRALPPDGLRYQFFLFDEPVANAWGLPGGRIYVSRKMVAFAHSEDELAGILAHEIGHIYTHQQAIDFTRWFNESLHVTQVAGRDDIFNRYHQLLESRKKGGHTESRHEREQLVADQMALYAVARAGYNVRAFVDFWDRLAETKGKTGGFWSDFFGNTSPESKRLREMLKTTAAMPPACVEQNPPTSQDAFLKWQSDVIALNRAAIKEELQGVLLKRALEPPLQGELSHLRFSPDGKYLLAQDDGGITILSREPLTVLFHVEAEEALRAQFTSDSQSLIFHTSGLRVESWSLAQRKRSWARELVISKRCLQTELSPDAKYLACYRGDFAMTVVDVATGASIFEKKDFLLPDFLALFYYLLGRLGTEGDHTIKWLNMGFSPDGRYLLAGGREAALIYDLSRRAQADLPGSIRHRLRLGFAFLGPDQIAVVGGEHGEKSAVLRFPTGETLATLTLGRQELEGATDSRYLLLRPIKEHPVGVFDWAQNKLLMGNRRPPLDVYDGIAVSEARDGTVAFSSMSADAVKTLASVQLPIPPLAGLRLTQPSDDLNLLALSFSSRGAVFDLQNGKRLFTVRGFRGAYFGDDGVIYADFPKYQETARTVARMKIKDANVDAGPQLAEDFHATQSGGYFLVRKPKKEKNTREDMTLEVQDVRSGSALWSRALPGEMPSLYPNALADALVLLWPANSGAAKDAARQSPELNRRFDSIRKKEDAYYLEVVELHSGKPLGRLLVDTKDAFDLRAVAAAGDFVALNDSQNRVLVYSLKSGEQTGKVFGRTAQLSAKGMLSVSSEGAEVTLYDAATMQKRCEYVFPAHPAYLQFSKDGNHMFALLKNQTVYVLDLKSAANVVSVTQSGAR